MSAGVYQIDLDQGADLELPLQWLTKPLDKGGVPIPLPGDRAIVQIRETRTSPKVLLELTTENSGIEIDQALGKVKLIFTNVGTRNLTEYAEYDLDILTPDDKVFRLLKGVVKTARASNRP